MDLPAGVVERAASQANDVCLHITKVPGEQIELATVRRSSLTGYTGGEQCCARESEVEQLHLTSRGNEDVLGVTSW